MISHNMLRYKGYDIDYVAIREGYLIFKGSNFVPVDSTVYLTVAQAKQAIDRMVKT